MDVFDAVRTILAVRRYKDQPVPVLWRTAAVNPIRKCSVILSEASLRAKSKDPQLVASSALGRGSFASSAAVSLRTAVTIVILSEGSVRSSAPAAPPHGASSG
jgi:hypothetical protein